MSRKIKNEQKKFLGETLNQYDKALNEGIDQLDKKNREQNHKISSLVNSFDNEFLEKDVEGNMTTLENSKDGMVIINEIQGSTEVNYCKDGEKELILNGDIDTQGESFVTITEGVDGGLVDVSLEGNTEINLSKTKDPVLVTREFDDINCNVGKLQYTIDDVTTINDEPGKVDIDRIVGDTMVNHAVNGSEELILNAHINESRDNSIKLNGITSDGGKVDVALEGNTLVNVSNVKDDYITPSIEDKVDQGSVISLPEVSEGLIHIDEIEGNTLVNYCTDGAKELTLNGDIDIEGVSVTTTEGVDNGLVDVSLEGNTIVNLGYRKTDVRGVIQDNGSLTLYFYTSDTELEKTHSLIKPSTTYTIVFFNKVAEVSSCYLMGTVGTISNNISVITTRATLENTYIHFYGTKEGATLEDFQQMDFIILEGDWTDKEIPEYFEGMKSVGQDDTNGHKIEVSSRNKNEINLVSYTQSFTDRLFGSYNARLPIMGKTFSYRYDYEIISISEEQDGFITNLAGTRMDNPTILADFDLTTVNQRLYNGAKGTVVVNNISNGGHTLTDIRCIRTSTPVTMTYKITNFALYFSDNANTYISYAENKKEILLNEPLRSLPNGVKDRFVKIGGKWFIERNCSEVVLDGSNYPYPAETSISNKKRWLIYGNSSVKDVPSNRIITINNKYRNITADDTWLTSKEGIAQNSSGNAIFMYLEKYSDGSDTSKQSLISELQQNPVTVVYQLATPVYEPLEIEPTLNTYNNTTHLSNNSIIPCNMQIKNTGYNAIIKPSTLYTVAVDTNKNGEIGINLGGAEVTTTNNVATITTPSTLTDDSLRLYGKGIKGSKVRLLEGDKTNWIPSFFEGMKSSFEDKVQDDGSYKMEILMNNKNLVKLKSENVYGLEVGSSYIIHSENSLTLNGTKDFSFIRIKQKLKPLTKYYISCDTTLRKGSGAGIRVIENRPGVPEVYTELYSVNSITTGNKIHIEGTFTTKYTPNLAIMLNSSWETLEDSELLIENLQISEVAGEFVENKSNKIQLSSIEPLRGVGDVHDRLVFKDGKLMIERNCKQSIFNNNTGLIDLYNLEDINVAKFAFRGVQPRMKLYQIVKCDKFGSKLYNSGIGIESVSVGGSNDLHVYIDKRKLPSLTLEGVKEWLQSNPLTVTYQLAEPTYEEIPSDLQKIILESYANGTLFFDTNIPPTKVSFNCFEEELTYLYPSTSYTIQFNSDRNTTADITLGGTQLLAQSIVASLNRISITTPETLVDNKLIINGAGAKISDIVVTDTDREFGYFEGMKSVGECEGNIEILSHNKNILNIKEAFTCVIGNWGMSVLNNRNPISGTINIENNTLTVSGNTNYHYLVFPVELKKGVTYYLNYNCNAVLGNGISFFTDLETTRLQTISSGNGTFVLRQNCKYIGFPFNNNINSYTLSDLYININGNYGYVEPKHNTQQLTHEPLRAVEDVKDRYVMIDGKWFIERNVVKLTFDGTDSSREWRTWLSTGIEQGECVGFYSYVQGLKHDVIENDSYTTVLNDNLPFIALSEIRSGSKEGIATGRGNDKGYFAISINRNKLNNITPTGFNEWLNNNPITIVAIGEPYYEPIDYNPLETYAEVTHITTNSTIPTNITVRNHGYNLVALKENTQYTLYVNKDTTNALTYRLGDYVEINSLSKFTFTTPSTLTDKTLRIDSKGAKVKDLMLIEGTPINDSVGYFDGLKSSYECEQVTDENDENYGKYKVEYKVTGKNKWRTDLIESFKMPEGVYYSNSNYTLKELCPNLIEGRQYKVSYSYDETGYTGGNICIALIPYLNISGEYFTYTKDLGDCLVYFYGGNLYNTFTNIQIEEGTQITEYEPYFESTQAVYLNSPLLKGDEIVWKDNKIQHYHKMKTVAFDGSNDEGWISYNSNATSRINTLAFGIYLDNFAYNWSSMDESICDKFCALSDEAFYNDDIEGINSDGNGNGRFLLAINKSRLTTQNVIGFKQWLQQNPIKVAYKLETPYYEEISDYPLKLNVIANSSLSTESTIQVTNISFNIYEETLPYLYPNTKYYITFNADVDRNNIIINLGGSHTVFDCKVGFNKVEITTPSDTTNLLTFSGTGVNIDHVKVTQQDIDEYFEGMKSVGECEELAITSANSDNTLSNAQQLTHEPLRAVGNVKDKYVLVDGKWYIERKCMKYVSTGDEYVYSYTGYNDNNISYIIVGDCFKTEGSSVICDKELTVEQGWNGHAKGVSAIRVNNENRLILSHYNGEQYKTLLKQQITFIYELASPIYEEISYNPFETYSDTTHISVNSLIPTNVVIKNHGYNCILKPSTKYTVALNKPNGTISAKLGGSAKVDSTNSIFTITTPSTLNDNVLRLSGSGKVKDIMVLEGDKTVNTPSYFEGIESVFEQEYDVEKGKYRVTARVEGNGKESSIIFYIDKPLRGTGTAKDKVFIQDGKVVVQRNFDSITVNGSEKIDKSSEGYDSANNITFSISMNNLLSAWLSPNDILCSTLPSVGHYIWNGVTEGITSDTQKILFGISRKRLKTQDINGFKQWLQQNPTTIVYALAESVYEEADCDLSKLVLENYENSSLIFESNIPVSANIRYSGEVPVVTQAKALSSKVDNTTFDINENIIPYMCDIDYRIVELQLMNGDTQGEGIELLGIGDIEILGNENVLFNNREDKKHNFSYDMLKRDILSQRYSKEEYRYRLDRYLLANKISDEEYKELEGLLNNGE